MAEESLLAVQGWMQRAILAGGATAAVADAVVAGDARLPAAARIGIYAGAYRARLLESLRGEYPALRRFAGDTAFDLFAQDYLAAHPSTSPTLYEIGRGFADHLAQRAPAAAREPGSLLAVPAQLARLERARAEVQRARGIERSAARITAELALLPGARLRLPDSVRLIRLDFDLAPLVQAADRDEECGIPEARETRIAVARSGYRVGIHALEAWQFALLEALETEGGELQAAAVASARACGGDTGRILADLALWLPVAGQLGLVSALDGEPGGQ